MFNLDPFDYSTNPRMLKQLNKLTDLIETNEIQIATHDILESEQTPFDEYYISQDYLDELKQRPELLDTNEYSKLFFINRQQISSITQQIIGIMWKDFKDHSIHVTGNFLYPTDNGFMGWHTNCGRLGVRIYMTYVREGDKSAFIYNDPNTDEIVWSYDKTGWTIRMFDTSQYDKPLWHAVWSNTDRYSFGFTTMELPK